MICAIHPFMFSVPLDVVYELPLLKENKSFVIISNLLLFGLVVKNMGLINTYEF